MKNLLLNNIRNEFINYFNKNNHEIVQSSNLVPDNDPTLLFANSGMVQFKNTFTGLEKRLYTRAVTSQKCIRAGGKHNDLENVGHTARHHTFFEMLGNFSFGDYFKEEAIYLAWNLLTKVFNLPEEKLLVTIYHEDVDAENLWKKISGLKDDKIIKISTNDNFWSMGDTGPCGPCSEIFYDHGDKIEGGKPGSVDEDGDRFIEIWNLVFMQYEQIDKETRLELPKPSIDTGMGLERVTAVLQGTHDNYEIDLFKKLVNASSSLTNTNINKKTITSHKVIADHIRSSSFLIAEGVMPSNEGRGYVLRRILRRAIRHSNILGCKEPFMHHLVKHLISEMGEAYPILIEGESIIKNTIKDEEIKFKETLDRGINMLNGEINNRKGNSTFSGKKAFELYDTYGFPLDLTQDVLKSHGWNVNIKEFEKEMDNQKNKSRESWVGSGDQAIDPKVIRLLDNENSTIFHGYDNQEIEGKIKLIIKDGNLIESLKNNELGDLIFDKTVFYAESGGQIGDQGIVQSDDFEGKILDCKKLIISSNKTVFLHRVKITKGCAKKYTKCNLIIDKNKRIEISSHHSSTHLLHEALRQKLGLHVKQRGSLVTQERLRFDFSHNKPINENELNEIEALVNEKILSKKTIETKIMTPDEAIKNGAIALFGEKYGDEVRVVSMGGESKNKKLAWSVELCGGTHLKETSEAIMFKIIQETGVSSGVRRIEAVTRNSAINYYKKKNEILDIVIKKLNTQPTTIINKIDQLVNEKEKLKIEINKLKKEILIQTNDNNIVDLNGIKFESKIYEDLVPRDLKPYAEKLLMSKKLDIVCIISKFNEKVSSVITVNKNNIEKYNAIELVNLFSKYLGGGKGGGRADMAQAGGQNIKQISFALDKLKEFIKNKE